MCRCSLMCAKYQFSSEVLNVSNNLLNIMIRRIKLSWLGCKYKGFTLGKGNRKEMREWIERME